MKIIVNKDKTTYQVVDEAYGEIPESRGVICNTALEAVNEWLRPNNDESGVAKFLTEVPVVEEEPVAEPIVGEIPHGNIINKIMGKDFMRPDTHHTLVDWCMEVLGYESTTDASIPHAGYDVLDEAFIAKLNARVQKIDNPMLLLKLTEVAKEGIRGCKGDKYNDAVAKEIQDACINRLQDYADSLPPSLWHKVHRHQLWQDGAETEAISLPSPAGWVSFKGIRPEKSGGWQVRMITPTEKFESPQYVLKMGLKARHDGYAKGSHSGVKCQTFHLFNHDGTLWGFEVYLISPLKTVGCEVTLDGRFSLFLSGVYLPPRYDVRQGDALFRYMEVYEKDEVKILTKDNSPLMRNIIITPETEAPYGLAKLKRQEHRHEEYDYWHPTARMHGGDSIMYNNIVVPENQIRQTDESMGEESVLVLNEDAVLKHPDHPSISLKTGYYRVLPVEGKTDYQPRQRGGD